MDTQLRIVGVIVTDLATLKPALASFLEPREVGDPTSLQPSAPRFVELITELAGQA